MFRISRPQRESGTIHAMGLECNVSFYLLADVQPDIACRLLFNSLDDYNQT